MDQICPLCGCSYAADQTGGLCPRCLANMAVHPTDPPSPGSPSPLEPNQNFRGYVVRALIAQGGMGVVYKARKPGETRDVALKILPPALAAENEFRLRFDREARALAGLSHPNIVRLLDFGVEGPLMFLVMEFIDGVSLREYLRDTPVTPARAVAIMLDLCRALDFAHHERVIHRDVKPENVLIDSTGRVKLTDFGLAKRLDPDATRVTQTNYAVGTPHYMAPEQLEAPISIDHRVDIYSLGVVFYEMLTRELPLGRFPLPSRRAGVDATFDEIVCRCLEKDSELRYPNVVALQAALSSLAVAPTPVPVKAPARPKVSSNLEIRCPCGWQFYIPAGARAGVHCPSCGEPVHLDSQAPPKPATVRAVVAGAPPAPARTLKLIAAVGLLLLLGIVLVVLITSPEPTRRDPRPRPEISYSTAPSAAPAPRPPVPAPPPPAPVPVVPPRPAPPRQAAAPAELRRQLAALTAEANMTGIVATILLNSGRPQDHEVLHDRLRSIDSEIQATLTQLEEQGVVVEAPARFQAGDRLVSFGGRRMEPSKSLAFSDDLRAWLRAFRPGVGGNIIVLRKRQNVAFDFVFPERTPDLVVLAHQAAVVLGDTPEALPAFNEPKPAAAAPIPASVLDPLRARFQALPRGYRDLLPYEDRGRADALLLAGQGSGEEIAFLSGRFTDLIRRCEEEQKAVPLRIKELEARLNDPAAQTDTVVCKDGRRIEGAILEETAEQVKVKARFGALTLKRDEIAKIEKGKGALSEFRAGYEAAKGRKSELLRLVAFAKEKKLAGPQELAALAVVAQEPGDERCRIDGGLPRTPFAVGPEPEPVFASDRIEYRGHLYTAEQFRSELKAIGYVFINGSWCEKIPRSMKIDNLYRDEAKVPLILKGAGVHSQTHAESDTVYDYQTKSWVPRTKQVSVARYIGGGTCFIEVSAPGDIIDARVHARSQVSRVGGSVTVSVVLDPGEGAGKLLYTLAGPGENAGSFDVTDKVAGRSKFYVRADVHGDGMFLVSDSNDLGVFEVKYSYGKPLERINALFGAALPQDGQPAAPKGNDDAVESGCRNLSSSAAQYPNLVDALSEVRKLSEGLTYSREYSLPSRFYDIGVQLRDPLAPDWNGMTREQALRLGSWWGLLPLEDRREFLTAYGVWCARARFQRTPR